MHFSLVNFIKMHMHVIVHLYCRSEDPYNDSLKLDGQLCRLGKYPGFIQNMDGSRTFDYPSFVKDLVENLSPYTTFTIHYYT